MKDNMTENDQHLEELQAYELTVFNLTNKVREQSAKIKTLKAELRKLVNFTLDTCEDGTINIYNTSVINSTVTL